jgi:hypothetical protein
MVTTDEDIRRERAWHLRFLSHFNECYWQRTAAALKRRQRYIQWVIAGTGLTASILVLVVTQEWIKSVIPAVALFVASFLRTLAWKSALTDARFDVERWSGLASDVDALWARAEPRWWKAPADAERLAELYERARQFQAREDHVSNDQRNRTSYRITCDELHVAPIEVDHVEREAEADSAETASPSP